MSGEGVGQVIGHLHRAARVAIMATRAHRLVEPIIAH
jgi:hypothetical protein